MLFTKSRIKVMLASATIGLASTAPAQAQSWGQFQPEDSQVLFTFEQMGVRMDGEFREFDAQLQFDPKQPTQGSARIEVMLGSVDLGSPEFDAEVVGSDWFDVKDFPKATFESTAIKSVSDDRFEVAGTLTIKGQTQSVVVPASFQQNGGKGLFEGEFTIERGQFKIGEGSWAKYDIVANDVTVKFRITALAN